MLAKQSKVLQELRELIRIISSVGSNERPVVSQPLLEKSSRLDAILYRTIRDHPELSEASLQQRLVAEATNERMPSGEGVLKSSSSSYPKLKSRLKLLLLNSLFLLDLTRGGYSEYGLILYSVNRMVFLARVLIALNARALSASIAKHALAKAMSIEEWSCAMEFLTILRTEASQSGQGTSHKFYVSEYLQCQKFLTAEQEAEVCMERLQLAFATFGGEAPEHSSIAEEAAIQIGKLAADYPSFKLSFLALRMRSIASQLRMDYRSVLPVCEEAFALLDRYPKFSNRARHAEYAMMKLTSAIQIHEHEKAEEAITQCELFLNDRENNWFTFKEWHFLHLTHNLKFKQALDIVKSIIAHRRFETLTEAVREKWELFRLYAEYVNGERVPVSVPEDFATLVPVFAADKIGLNTGIIVLHLLLLAERRQYSKFQARMEFVKGYRKRFLKGPENAHAAHFFKMLSLIETCDLNYGKTVHRSRSLMEELERIEREEPIQGEQILPYSWIWNRLMERLKEYRPVNLSKY